MYFYKKYKLWELCGNGAVSPLILPSGSCGLRRDGGDNISIFNVSTEEFYFEDIDVKSIMKEDGEGYVGIEEFLTLSCDFFLKATDNLISESNSTTTILGANQTFIGEWVDTSVYGTATIGVKTDVNSATDGLIIEYSCDGVGCIQDDRFTILGNVGKVFTVGMTNRYLRVRYINGPTPQTSFDIQTILKTAYIKPSSHRISDSIIGDDDAELVKAVITGLRDDKSFGNVILDNENRLQTIAQPYLFGVAEQSISGHFPLLKFGVRTSIIANTQSTIWEGVSNRYQYLSSASQLSIVSSSISDNSNGTGARTITILGLDSNFIEQSETITMNGTTPVVTAKSFIRTYRAFVYTCGTNETNVGNINITSTVGNIQLIYIPAGDGQTLMTLWTVPADKVAYLTQLTVSNDSGKGARFAVYTRQIDGGTLYPWQIKYRGYMFGGVSVIPFNIPFKIPAKTDIEVRFLTGTNAGITSGGATFELWYENI